MANHDNLVRFPSVKLAFHDDSVGWATIECGVGVRHNDGPQ
jgi:hypothetical protein